MFLLFLIVNHLIWGFVGSLPEDHWEKWLSGSALGEIHNYGWGVWTKTYLKATCIPWCFAVTPSFLSRLCSFRTCTLGVNMEASWEVKLSHYHQSRALSCFCQIFLTCICIMIVLILTEVCKSWSPRNDFFFFFFWKFQILYCESNVCEILISHYVSPERLTSDKRKIFSYILFDLLCTFYLFMVKTESVIGPCSFFLFNSMWCKHVMIDRKMLCPWYLLVLGMGMCIWCEQFCYPALYFSLRIFFCLNFIKNWK